MSDWIWDNNIVLDLLLDRMENTPSIFELYEYFVVREGGIQICASQIHTIHYVFRKKKKRHPWSGESEPRVGGFSGKYLRCQNAILY